MGSVASSGLVSAAAIRDFWQKCMKITVSNKTRPLNSDKIN